MFSTKSSTMAAAAMRISDRGCSSPSPPPPWLNFSSSSNKKCAHVPRNGSPQLTFDGAREGQMYDDVFFPIAAPFRVPTHAINIVDGGWHHGGPGSMQWSRHHCCRRRALSSPPPPEVPVHALIGVFQPAVCGGGGVRRRHSSS